MSFCCNFIRVERSQPLATSQQPAPWAHPWRAPRRAEKAEKAEKETEEMSDLCVAVGWLADYPAWC